jgi:hypothetical protein
VERGMAICGFEKSEKAVLWRKYSRIFRKYM